MPKRKDAQQPLPRRTEPARPAPARPPPAQPSGPHKPSYWRLAFIFLRIAVCAGALYVLYQKLHGPAPVTDEADDPERVTFEPIERDEQRRQAILDAFKASLPRDMLQSTDLTLSRGRSTRTRRTSEMHSASTSTSTCSPRFHASS